MTGSELSPHGRDEYVQISGRRQILCALAGLVGVLSLGPTSSIGANHPPARALDDWLQRSGPTIFADPAALARLGAQYLVEHPHERDLRTLSRLLLGEGPTSVELRLIESIARDWREHYVVAVKGWVLARAEARLCAALHLLDDAPV